MKPKTCIVLSAVALVLRALALLAVLLMTALQDSVKRLWGVGEEALAVRTVPWTSIVQTLIWLILAVVVLLVLLKRPGRGGAIVLTLVTALLWGFFSVVFFPVLSFVFTRVTAGQGGTQAIASASVLSSALSLALPILSTPASILSLLALGGACGKDFRSEA